MLRETRRGLPKRKWETKTFPDGLQYVTGTVQPIAPIKRKLVANPPYGIAHPKPKPKGTLKPISPVYKRKQKTKLTLAGAPPKRKPPKGRGWV